MIETIIAVVIGAAISFIFYFLGVRDLKREAESLREEAAALRKLQELTIFALANSSAKIVPTRNEEGTVTGITVSAEGHSMGISTAGGVTPSQNGSGQGS